MKRTLAGDILWLSLLLLITVFLILPNTHQVFIQWTNQYPYLMGFIKFAILATMGELLALRLAHQTWQQPVGMIYKIIVWGLIGVMITFMFSFYSAGVSTLFNQGDTSFLSRILPAFLTSAIMNLTFGIVFMGMHRMTDTYIEMRINNNKPNLSDLIKTINWEAFISFVVFKTIPLFWIPAHTITFLLPPHYRVLIAAYLSIVLGVILVYSQRILQQKVT
ncbi:MAG: Mpv17/PMP22 family protein [Brevefilum sp.]|nr:Mpv17/PMP22 family protein [Brevefilum sp.]